MRRGPLTPEGRERLRQAALQNRPWELATGPRTAEGKQRSAANGRAKQRGPKSVRELRREVADVHRLIKEMTLSLKAVADRRDSG